MRGKNAFWGLTLTTALSILPLGTQTCGAVVEQKPAFTPKQINERLSSKNILKDLVQQSINDGTLRLGDLTPLVPKFEQGLVTAGASPNILVEKKRALSVTVQTVLTKATLAGLAESFEFIFPNRSLTVASAGWATSVPPAMRSILFTKARYPGFDPATLLLVGVPYADGEETLDRMVFQFAKSEEWVEVTGVVTFENFTTRQTVKVPIQNLAMIQKVFLQQAFGAERVVFTDEKFYRGLVKKNERLIYEGKLVYALGQIIQSESGLLPFENYPFASFDSREDLRRRWKVEVRRKDWQAREAVVKKSALFLTRVFGNSLGEKLNALPSTFEPLFDEQFGLLVNNAEIQSYAEVVRFFRGMRIGNDQIYEILKSINQKNNSAMLFPSLRDEFYTVMVNE